LGDLYVQAKAKAKECKEARKQKGDTEQSDFLSRVSDVLAQMQKDISTYRAQDNTLASPSPAFEGWVRKREKK
jgi:hypothetical protein